MFNGRFQDKKTVSPIFYEDLEIISDISNEILSNLAFDDIVNTAVAKIVTRLRLLGGILFLQKEDHLVAQTIAGSGIGANSFLKLIGGSVSKLIIKVNESNISNLVVKSIYSKNVEFSYDLKDFTNGVLSTTITSLAKAMTQTKACIAIPLLYNNEPLGAMFFSKNRREDFNLELPILQILANHIGIAITNAKLFMEINDKNRKLQRALSTVNELRRQEKDMIDVMGHELKTPMTTIHAVLEILSRLKKNNQLDEDTLEKYLSLGLDSSKKEISLIDTLLTATKVEANKLEVGYENIDIVEIVKRNIESFRKTISRKDLVIKYSDTGKSLFVKADRIRLYEIIDNLMSNAIKYTDKGYIEIKIIEESRYVNLVVKDSGIGIEREDLKYLGRKFFRANLKNLPEGFVRPAGTGLGLYVVYGLVQAMNGTVGIDSEPGKGSTFSVRIPKVRK